MEAGFKDEYRTKQKYDKVDNHFWAVEKSELAQAKKQNIDRELKEADEKFNANRPVDIDYESMTVSQLKDQLTELDLCENASETQTQID